MFAESFHNRENLDCRSNLKPKKFSVSETSSDDSRDFFNSLFRPLDKCSLFWSEQGFFLGPVEISELAVEAQLNGDNNRVQELNSIQESVLLAIENRGFSLSQVDSGWSKENLNSEEANPEGWSQQQLLRNKETGDFLSPGQINILLAEAVSAGDLSRYEILIFAYQESLKAASCLRKEIGQTVLEVVPTSALSTV